MNFIVHLKRFAHDGWIAAEFVLPVLIAEEQDRRRREFVVVRDKRAAKQWLYFEQIEIISGDNRRADAIRVAVAQQNERHAVVFHQTSERFILFSIILNLMY